MTFHNIDQKYDHFRMLYIRKFIPFFLKKIPSILAISNSTKNDLIHFYKVEADKISVAYNGYNHEKFNAIQAKKNTAELLKTEKKYILYVARVEHPGKNHLNLVKAYELLPQKIQDEYILVCAGGLKERSEEVIEYVNNSPSKNNILFTGFFPGEDLPDLYKNASLFVMPSLYEGFGTPLVEAMACKIPVVCSDRGPMPEVVGNAAKLFNPDKPEEIKDTIAEILSNDDLKKEFVKKGLERSKIFSWINHAQTIMTLFEQRNQSN